MFAITLPHNRPHFVIEGDRGETPGTIWPVDMFIVTDDRPPSNWAVTIDEDDKLMIGPRSWLRTGFWDDLTGSHGTVWENRVAAADDYRRERGVIPAES